MKDIAYNPDVKAIIVFSDSEKSAKLVSAMRPAAKGLQFHLINVSRKSLAWGVQSIIAVMRAVGRYDVYFKRRQKLNL